MNALNFYVRFGVPSERDVTAPWAKEKVLRRTVKTKEPTDVVKPPSSLNEPKAEIVKKGVASGGENPWGVSLRKQSNIHLFVSSLSSLPFASFRFVSVRSDIFVNLFKGETPAPESKKTSDRAPEAVSKQLKSTSSDSLPSSLSLSSLPIYFVLFVVVTIIICKLMFSLGAFRSVECFECDLSSDQYIEPETRG